MAHYDTRTKELVLTQEDKEAMNGKNKIDSNSIINWLLFGNKEGRITTTFKRPAKITKKPSWVTESMEQDALEARSE